MRSSSPSDETPDSATAHWQRVKALWHAVHDQPDDVQAAHFSDATWDDDVRDEVRRLLRHAATMGDRFETPALVAFGQDALMASTLADVRAGVADAARDGGEPAGPMIGRRLGRYQIVRRIGAGGMGAVYEAQRVDAAYAQRVAIKTLWRGADSALLLQRFVAERQILAGLQHPNIAQLLDGGSTDDGTPWLALEYVNGTAIDVHCDALQLGVSARLDLFRQVCAAVEFAHRQFVVHRDLKPSNVFVASDGTVKLLDFGVAKLIDQPGASGTLTEAGLAPYTAPYAAPEQLSGAPITVATDVYGLGALLVQLLVGQPPLDVRDLVGTALVERIVHTPAQSPSAILRAMPRDAAEDVARRRGLASADRLARVLDGELDAIALMALRKEPERRYASAAALGDDVHRFLRRDRVRARPDTLDYRLRTFVRRRPALVTGVLVGAVALASVTATWGQQRRLQQREAQRTERVARFMAGLVAGPDAVGDPLVRIGPRGTVAELLDNAVARIPLEFGDDPGSRARLYTAIGANLASQEEFARAAVVLDSAVRLSRLTFGEPSEAFVTAALELARVRFAAGGPAASRDVLDAATRALGNLDAPAPSLVAGLALMRGRVLRGEGFVRTADSVAREQLRRDSLSQRPPDMSTVRSQLLLAITGAWLERDPRIYVRQCRRASALLDSLNANLSVERLEAALCEVDGLLTLGHIDDADALVRETMGWYERAYGMETTGMASLLAASAGVAAARGERAVLWREMQRAQRILEATDAAPAEAVVAIATALVELQRADGALDQALQLARWARARAVPQQVAVATIVAHFTQARVHVDRREWDEAAESLRRGLAAFPPSGDLDSMRPQLLRTLLAVAEARGDRALADSVRAELPVPQAARPDCTPGGRWTGCAID